MITRKTGVAVGLATLGLFAAPAVKADPLQPSVTSLSGMSDASFQNLLLTGEFTESFVAESRIGRGMADRQLGINQPIVPNGAGGFKGGLPVASGFTTWVSGQAVQFSLEYTGSLVKYIVGGKTLSTSAFTGPVNTLFLRTFAGVADTQLSLTNLVLKTFSPDNKIVETQVGGLSSQAGNSTNYLRISNISTPFTLTGQSIFSWGSTVPKNSQLAYQIKAGNAEAEAVPEPATLLGLALGASGLAGARARRHKQNA